MEILGHSTITLIMNPYSYVLPSAQHDAAALLDNLFNNPLSNVSLGQLRWLWSRQRG